MTGAEYRELVLDAVEDGILPRGGPSDAAAHDLLDAIPPGYWACWSSGAAGRIRAQVSAWPRRELEEGS
jgi:hypothetical protein